ncbi:hypothetical protein KW882_00615 [Vibrio parahaemolyticus]
MASMQVREHMCFPWVRGLVALECGWPFLPMVFPTVAWVIGMKWCWSREHRVVSHGYVG